MKTPFNIFISFCLLLWFNNATAQRNNVWCFGDSAGIDFSVPANPTFISTSLVTRGTCASLSDQLGELKFYCETRAGIFGNSGLVFNKDHQLMFNGDSILGQGWYQEMIIIPDLTLDSTSYIFSIGVTTSSQPGLFYSKVGLSTSHPLGIVTQKNIQLLNFKMVDCINAVKHGNGRDWWIMVRPSPIGQPQYNNEWHLFLISPAGISQMPIQYVGSINATNAGSFSINPDGNRIVFINSISMIEIYDFDRCTGLVSNPVNIEMQSLLTPYPYYWSCEFSSNGRYLYVSSQSTTNINYLWQYDTWSTNIFSTKTLIWQAPSPPSFIGALKRGPDNKIYVSTSWCSPNGASNYPYDSTMYYLENMNLSVINSPDSAGVACDFQPWSFYLGGKRSYLGLPNNPDYDLGPLAGSPCDTLVGISESHPTIITPQLNIFYHPEWQTSFINANNLTGTNGTLEIFDVQGKMVHQEEIQIVNGYYTRNFNMTGMAEGMYFVNIISSSQRLSGKLVKY